MTANQNFSTFTLPAEINRALRKGYEIEKVFEVILFEETMSMGPFFQIFAKFALSMTSPPENQTLEDYCHQLEEEMNQNENDVYLPKVGILYET